MALQTGAPGADQPHKPHAPPCRLRAAGARCKTKKRMHTQIRCIRFFLLIFFLFMLFFYFGRTHCGRYAQENTFFAFCTRRKRLRSSPSAESPASRKYIVWMPSAPTMKPPRFCIKIVLTAFAALITPSAVETEFSRTMPRTTLSMIIINSVEPTAFRRSIDKNASHALDEKPYSRNCSSITAKPAAVSARPEKRSINRLENKMTGSSTSVLSESAVPTKPVESPSSCSRIGLYVMLRFDMPEKTSAIAAKSRNIGFDKNES